MKFNNEFYNQVKGAAMGAICTPTYATFSMGYFLKKLHSFCTFEYGELLAECIEEKWNHILDDSHTVSRSSQINLEELLLILDMINPSIQFTMEYSKH